MFSPPVRRLDDPCSLHRVPDCDERAANTAKDTVQASVKKETNLDGRLGRVLARERSMWAMSIRRRTITATTRRNETLTDGCEMALGLSVATGWP